MRVIDGLLTTVAPAQIGVLVRSDAAAAEFAGTGFPINRTYAAKLVTVATELADAARRAALQLFPGKEAVYDLIYRPKFRRLINQVYRLQ